MNFKPQKHLLLSLSLFMAFSQGLASAQTLRIGLAEDPDVLDPTLARSFVGRIVFSSLCDKLFDIDEKLNILPQLASSYEWSSDSKALTLKIRQGVTFHDGEKLDAAAVKFNIERHKNLPGSNHAVNLRPNFSASCFITLFTSLPSKAISVPCSPGA